MPNILPDKEAKEELKIKVFKAFDSLDDESVALVKKGMDTRVEKSWVYYFKQGSQEVWGVGKEGIDEITNYLAKFGILFQDVEVNVKKDEFNPEYALVTAKVQVIYADKNGNRIEGPQKIGSKRQWTKMKVYKRDKRGFKVKDKNGHYVTELQDDPFWFEKGTMKAIRNATRRLIEGHYLEMVIAKAKKLNKVRKVTKEEVETGIVETPTDSTPVDMKVVRERTMANGDALIDRFGDVLEEKDIERFHTAVANAKNRGDASSALAELTEKIERRRRLKNKG